MFKIFNKLNFLKKPHIRIAFSVSIIVIFLTILGVSFVGIKRSLFSRNEHFTIKQVLIKGSVSWEAREVQILQYGKIKLGETNLFSVDIRKLREKIISLPSVENASVSRKLPDILIINIEERIPRVAFNFHGRRWYADEKGVVFSAASYGKIKRDLPLLGGFSLPETLAEGDTVSNFIFPATLSAICNRYYPEFSIQTMDLSKKRYLIVKIRSIDDFEIYTAIFPKEKAVEKFALFKWALAKSIEEDTGKKIFDLRFEGQVVTR